MATHTPWPKRPSKRWPDSRNEDEYECHACAHWKPWFYWTATIKLVLGARVDTYHDWAKYADDNGGIRFACDACMRTALWRTDLLKTEFPREDVTPGATGPHAPR